MDLTEGILKSIESGFYTTRTVAPIYALKYKGLIFKRSDNSVRLFYTPGAAKTAITNFLVEIFRQGEYWQEYKRSLEIRTGHDIDFSATIKIFPSYGKTDRFYSVEFKNMIKDLRDKLLKEKIFTIEEII